MSATAEPGSAPRRRSARTSWLARRSSSRTCAARGRRRRRGRSGCCSAHHDSSVPRSMCSSRGSSGAVVSSVNGAPGFRLSRRRRTLRASLRAGLRDEGTKGRRMDLGLRDATAVVQGGTQGMGRAAAECSRRTARRGDGAHAVGARRDLRAAARSAAPTRSGCAPTSRRPTRSRRRSAPSTSAGASSTSS